MRRGHIALRTCIGCRERYPKSGLVRFVTRDGSIVLGAAEGRGLYLCGRQDCFDRALQRKGLGGLSGRRPDCPDLAPLRDAVARAKHAACGASGGGAIG